MNKPTPPIPSFQPDDNQPSCVEFQSNAEVKTLGADLRSPKLPQWTSPDRVVVTGKIAPEGPDYD